MGKYKKYKKLAALIGAKIESKEAFVNAYKKQKAKGLKEYGHSLKDSGLSVDEVRAHQLEEFVDIIAYQKEIQRLSELEDDKERIRQIKFYKTATASLLSSIWIGAFDVNRQIARSEIISNLYEELEKPDNEVHLKRCEALYRCLLILSSPAKKEKTSFEIERLEGLEYEKE